MGTLKNMIDLSHPIKVILEAKRVCNRCIRAENDKLEVVLDDEFSTHGDYQDRAAEVAKAIFQLEVLNASYDEALEMLGYEEPVISIDEDNLF